MTPRKSKEGIDNEDGLVVEKTKEEIEKQLEEVEKVWEFNLSDLEGIGPIKLKKLNSHGIFKAEDLLIRGANELAELLELTPDKTQKMIDDARDYLEKHDVVGKAVIDGLSLLNYRTEKIKYLRTGASNLDEALGGGYETGVITELYGEFGSGKTQFCLVASVLAQLPIKKQCFECHEQFDDSELIRCPKCNVKLETKGGGLSLPNHPCKVLYMDTENSYRSDRVLTIVKELGLVKTKPQSITEEKRGDEKEFLNEEEKQKAYDFIRNTLVMKPSNASSQWMMGQKFVEYMEKDKEKQVKLIIIDSLTNHFRLDYSGRGELSNRQVLLNQHVKHISRLAEYKNVVILVANQVQQDLSMLGYGDKTKPIGGMTLGHVITHRIYLKKKGNKGIIIAHLVDSPNHAKTEAVLVLTKKGIENGEG